MNSAQTIENLVDKIRHLPADRVAEVEDFVDFLSQRAKRQQAAQSKNESFEFPVVRIDDWPENLNLSREEMYGDDGR
jgi:hypothetical protein